MSECYEVLVVRGQNGLGLGSTYIQTQFETALDATHTSPFATRHPVHYRTVWSGIPARMREMDFGQTNCINLLTEAFDKIDAHRDIVLYANSQGTATVLNWMSDSANSARIRGRVRLVVLEAVMASGNTAIWHTIHSMIIPSSIRYIIECLKLDALVPVLVSMFVFRAYEPLSPQPLKRAENFPRNIPVVIVHSRGDRQLSYNDACALQHLFRKKLQMNHTYLCTRADEEHMDIYSSVRSVCPAPYPRLSSVVYQIFAGHPEALDTLFERISPVAPTCLTYEAEHPIDGVVSYEACYDHVMNFDRRVQFCRNFVTGSLALLIIATFVFITLYILS